MALNKFSKYTIEFSDGSRLRKMFSTKIQAQAYKKIKKISGRVIKVVFKSA